MLRRVVALLSVLLVAGFGGVACGGGGTVARPDLPGVTAVAEAIRVQTARGVVELPRAATKVVAADRTSAEVLLALGVTPVGATEPDTRGATVAGELTMPGDVTDVGTADRPNPDQIALLRPDLVVTHAPPQDAALDRLRAIAPVLVFEPSAEDPLAALRRTVGEIGKAVGKQERAASVLRDLDGAIAAARDDLAGIGGSVALAAAPEGSRGARGVQMFSERSLAGALLREAGLRNGWPTDRDGPPVGVVDVPGLRAVSTDATLLYLPASASDRWAAQLSHDPVGRTLPFVKDKRVRSLDADTWLSTGPIAARDLLEQVSAALRRA